MVRRAECHFSALVLNFSSPGPLLSRENRKKALESGGDYPYVIPAQFRTCLWPRACRWASGQEAGQPPGTWVRSRGMDIPEARIPVRKDRVPNNDRQPEAKPANPALHGGRSLKQRRSLSSRGVGGDDDSCRQLSGRGSKLLSRPRDQSSSQTVGSDDPLIGSSHVS